MNIVALYREISDHHGVVTTERAKRHGMSYDQICTREQHGERIRARRGVYVVAGSSRSKLQGFELALSGRPEAVLSHQSAAELLTLRYVPTTERCQITIPTGSSRRFGDVAVYESSYIGDLDVVTKESLRSTSVERTIVDLAARMSGTRLNRTIEDALDRKLTTPCRLNETLERIGSRGKSGTELARHAIPSKDVPRTESELERRFLRFTRRAKLPTPQTQVDFLAMRNDGTGEQVVGRCDFAFTESKVVVELDGQRGHSQWGSIERDHLRDQLMAQEGWLVVRVTWAQVTAQPDALASRLRSILATRTPQLST